MKIENKNTIVNFSNSVLKHFGAPVHHETIPEIDHLLEGHGKVVVFLFDGLGTEIIQKHRKESQFIHSHYVHTMRSTFAPTTAAATTAFLSGLYPIETGWMAWSQYFPEYDCNINLFKNERNSDGKLLKDKKENIAFAYCPYETIFEQIRKADKCAGVYDFKQYPCNPNGPKSLRQGMKMLDKALENETCFVYFYWTDPDATIHDSGTRSRKVGRVIRRLDRFVKKMTGRHKDTLFLSIADHGLIDVTYTDMTEHEDLYRLMYRFASFEKRCPTFFVKEENKATFATLFNKYYGDFFDLYSKEEVLKKKFYGDGLPNPKAVSFIGDFLAIAKTGLCLYDSKYCRPETILGIKAHHAGFTKDEMLIDVSAYNIR